jgi:hypothetical protein
MADVWAGIEAEARGALGQFPVRAYSEFMPPPFIGWKPYTGDVLGHGDTFDIDEYDQAHDLEPGLERIGAHLVAELGKLVRGEAHALSKTLLAGNPAWPDELAAAARAGKLAHDPLIVICPLALSRTQDDKGNTPWTLFGTSHEGPAVDLDHDKLLAWAGLDPARTLITFTPFSQLPADVRAKYLAGVLTLVPTPASLVLFEHPRYRELAHELPRAQQIPMLHLFPRVEKAYAIRVPQSGWLDESDPETGLSPRGHKVVTHLTRTHRWQRVARDAGIHGDGMYTDHVSVALFSTTPEAIDLYDKPLARNSQIWSEDYKLVLDGPHATRDQLQRAAGVVDAGGRFGYRMYYPPMRAGLRELFWHYPLIASPRGRYVDGPLGHVSAERHGEAPMRLEARLLSNAAHAAAARLFEKDPGLARHTTCRNARKLIEARELLGESLGASYARALIHCAKGQRLEDWLADLPQRASDRNAGARFASTLRGLIAFEDNPGVSIVLEQLGTRAFEEKVWTTIAHLAHGEFHQKNDADGIRTNRGKTGGAAAKKAHVHWHERRDLDALGDHLHARYRELIEANGMTGRAHCVDHVFRWETDFEFPWMEGWVRNQEAPAERNVVMMIPGKNRGEAVVMGDHYDTAYMEDVFYAESGGDALRAPACGADDNHSATTALLLAAEQLLPLAKAGKLERDVWLVHLTGEEFPADCMGARHLARGLVEKSLKFTAEDGAPVDVSQVRVVGAFILDMIGHNADRDRDVFQMASGEGAGSAKLARIAQQANERWNALATRWNRSREHLARAERVKYTPGSPPPAPPPPFAHLPLHGEVRVEWEPRSALFNTDGQIFSDLGIPVVLFMENYDISRKGYHDTHDTMENIDLDYCAAVTAIAIETVAATACAPHPT